MMRYLTLTSVGILYVLVAPPAAAQQGRLPNTAAVDLGPTPQVIILYRGTSVSHVNPIHPHGGPPGQLKRLYGGLPPGQAKKLYGVKAFSNEIEIEFDYTERERLGESRIGMPRGKLKKLYRRAPPGHVKIRGVKGFKRDKAKKSR